MIWVLFALLAAAIAIFVAGPLMKRGNNAAWGLIGLLAMISIGLYVYLGQPQLPDQGIADRRADRTVALDKIREGLPPLQAQLVENPDDMAGWWLLAQSYGALDDKAGEKAALERLMQLMPDMAPMKARVAERLDELKN